MPESPKPGQPRTYRVDAWISPEGEDPVRVTGVWISKLSDGLRKALLKELGLPVKKDLVYKETGKRAQKVIDLKISDCWDGWCNIVVKLEDGTIPPMRVHSMHLSEMNRSTDDVLPQNFTVIDVESTGLSWRSSDICELAAIKVKNGEPYSTFSQLVYIDGEMPKSAAMVNHISNDMLRDQPHMTEAMQDFLDFIGDNSVLVGHNINDFDIRLIARVAQQCGLRLAFKESIDTLPLSRIAWPNRSNTMDSIRTRLDLDQDGAHRALNDCYDELDLYMKLRQMLTDGEFQLPDQAEKFKLSGPKRIPQTARDDTKEKESSAPQKKRPAYSSKWRRKKAKDFSTTVTSFDEGHPLYDKNVVISGDVVGHSYDQCMQTICDLGGHPQDNVTRQTDYLVVGVNPGMSKLAKAQENKAKGQDIRIIGEGDFSKIVGWEES